MGQSNDSEKTSAKTPDRELVPQPHGGALSAGNPGNSGGKKGRSGRPPSKIREKLRGSFQKRIRILEQFADGIVIYTLRDGEKPDTDAILKLAPSVADRLKALDMMAKYGVGTTSTMTDVEGNDAQTLTDAIRAARAAGPDGE
jgi:hypothetical protein